jgi:hypothetical protein
MNSTQANVEINIGDQVGDNMKKRNRIGCIVVADGQPMVALKDHRWKYETLWFGTRATIFKTNKDARNAIRRTLTFRDNHLYLWPWMNKAIIVPIER